MATKTCAKCGNEFRCRQKINGKTVLLYSRKYCLDCSPYGKHNTAQLERTPDTYSKYAPSAAQLKKARCRTRAWRRWIKRHLIDYKGGKCELCGYDKPYLNSFAFHHRDPAEKDFGISRMSNRRDVAALEAEVDKCDLLCVTCHAELHEDERRTEIEESLAEYDQWLSAQAERQDVAISQAQANCLYCKKDFKKCSPNQKYCSPACSALSQRKVGRPSRDELRSLIETKSFLAIGRQFGVSDNTIRKWARGYGLNPAV